MRLFDTDTYEEIIKDAKTSPFAVSIDGDMDEIQESVEKLVHEAKIDRETDCIFIMNHDMKMKFTVSEQIYSMNARSFMGHRIECDADMPKKTVLFIDPDLITVSGKILGIERIGVIDFSENDTEQEDDE